MKKFLFNSGLLRFYFPRFYPRPKVGETWIAEEELNDPWNATSLRYTIIDEQGDWFRLRFGEHGCECSKRLPSLLSFYRKVADAPNDNDEPPPF